MREVDDRVLSMLEGQMFDPDVLADAVTEAIRRIKGDNPARRRAEVKKRVASLTREVANLTQAIAAGAASVPALVSALQAKDQERARLVADLAQLDSVDHMVSLKKDLKADLEVALVDWRGLIRANVQQARQIISKLLARKLTVTPDTALGVAVIDGEGVLEPLLRQAVHFKALVAPTGFEPVFQP
jgi:hypothetical protein